MTRLYRTLSLMAATIATATLAACSASGDQVATTTTTAPTTRETTTTTLSIAERQQARLDAMGPACRLWVDIEAPVGAGDTGQEPGRSQLLEVINLLKEDELGSNPDSADAESFYSFFDPVTEYIAFGTNPGARNDPRYVGDRDAFLMLVGMLNERCR
ncbi:MAG TPA: hypothetical protein VIR58_12040 [Acidimicrobiales bacterium]